MDFSLIFSDVDSYLIALRLFVIHCPNLLNNPFAIFILPSQFEGLSFEHIVFQLGKKTSHDFLITHDIEQPVYLP